MKKILLIILVTIGIMSLNAQNEAGKWAFGGGISSIDFSGPITKQFFNVKEYRASQRYFVGRYLNPSFNLKADFTFGKVWFPRVADEYPDVIEGLYQNKHIYDFGLNIEYKLNNGYILKEKAIVAPYLFTGIGFNTVIDYGKIKGTDINTYIPFGLGLTIRATNWLSFNLQAAYKLNLDNSYDYTQSTASAMFTFGGKPKGAKVTDVSTEVIDSDKDGIADLVDECPFAAGPENMFGCPDTDGDGLGDSRDDCPQVIGNLINKGCPARDTDGDGVADDKDSCPEIKGEKRYAGCPDTDGDGIVDKYDKCPNKPGIASNNGCPANTPEPKSSDVVTPNQNISVSTPIVTTPVVSTPVVTTPVAVSPTITTPNVVVASTNSNTGDLVEKLVVYFGSASDVVPTSEKEKLNKIISSLSSNPNYKVLIKGYTDEHGDEYANIELSLKRATTVWQYLSDNGMSGEKGEVFGYGEYNKASTSDNANRRVEIEIVK